MDQLLKAIADDWRTARDLGERIAKAKLAGASWRAISHKTGIPTTTVRRRAKPFLTQNEPGVATPPPAGL